MSYSDQSPLIGEARGTAEQAIAWLVSRKVAAERAARIVTAYRQQAAAFGLDWLLALSQSVHETTNVETGEPFASWWCSLNNFAGVGVTGERRAHSTVPASDWQPHPDGYDYRGYQFASIESGVLAHLVHLAAYAYRPGQEPASGQVLLNATNDPRLDAVQQAGYRGRARVLRDLDGRWAVPGTGYGASVAKIANLIAAMPAGTETTTMTLSKPTVDSSYQSPNRDGVGVRQVRAVVWHITQGTDSRGWLCNPSSGASSNYLIERDGTPFELVPPDHAAWANGPMAKSNVDIPIVAEWVRQGINPNAQTVSIEHEGFTSNNRGGSLTAAQIETTIQLTAWLCQRYGIPPDRQHILRHADIDGVNRPYCPGFSTAEMESWIARVAALVGGGSITVDKTGDEAARLRADVEGQVPVHLRGTLLREGVVDLSAFGGGASERLAVYEKGRYHRLGGTTYAFFLSGPASFEALSDAGKITLY